MIIIELLGWIIKFAIAAVLQPIQTLFILFSSASIEQKIQAVKQALMMVPILVGIYLIFTGNLVFGLVLIIGTMVLTALIVKDDGTI
ncbi:MAG: hypothetical protein IT273_10805 [Chitinophagales bacterium]|nr:hypothetical protein [Chitinophagales bacterium]